MSKLGKALRRLSILASFATFPLFGAGNSSSVLHANTLVHKTLPEVVVVAKKMPKRVSTRTNATEFMGFALDPGLDTTVHKDLRAILTTYTGPSVKISSLVRHKWSHKSKHRSGRAVDFRFSHELIEWLVSEEGTKWRTTYGLTFYIEGKPGSKALTPYKNNSKYSQFVFENRKATGNHIHLNL